MRPSPFDLFANHGAVATLRRWRLTCLGAPAAVLLLGACTNSLVSQGFERVTPYRLEIVQGNVITREQIEAVKPGMNREQVRGVFGSPLLADMFHTNRWDYVFSLRRQGEVVQRKTITAWFEGDVLKKVDAPSDLPTENEFVATLPTQRRDARIQPKLELSDAERQALPVPTRETARVTTPVGALRPYPPLEPRK